MFSEGAAPFTISPAVFMGFNCSRLQTTPAIIYLFYYNHFHGVKLDLIVVLSCLSLKVRDDEYLFMSLLAICIYPEEKCLFKLHKAPT